MNNLNELKTLTASIDSLDNQIKNVNRNPIKDDILNTYDKGFEIIDDCRKFIEDNLDFFINTPLCLRHNHGDSIQYWFNGGITFLIKDKKCVRCWVMRKYDGTGKDQSYFDHEGIDYFDWYKYDTFKSTSLNGEVEKADDIKLLSIKREVDYFYAKCESLYGLIADALTKTKEYKEKYLKNLTTALDNGANKKEVIYKIEITKETKD